MLKPRLSWIVLGGCMSASFMAGQAQPQSNAGEGRGYQFTKNG